jgi:hypothetical protein
MRQSGGQSGTCELLTRLDTGRRRLLLDPGSAAVMVAIMNSLRHILLPPATVAPLAEPIPASDNDLIERAVA